MTAAESEQPGCGLSIRVGEVFRFAGPGWGGWLANAHQAIATREVVAIAAAGEFHAADRRELIEHLHQSSAEILAAIGSCPGAALELRYLVEPRPGEAARVRLLMNVKAVRDSDPNAAIEEAEAAIERACAALPVGFAWQPVDLVSAEVELGRDAALVEVRKQEELLQPQLRNIPADFYYITYPVHGDGSGWPSFGQALSKLAEPLVVSLLFEPTKLVGAETGAIGHVMTALEHFGHSRQEPDVLGNMTHVPADANAAAALSLWRGYQESLRQCVLARATVAGSRAAARQIAASLQAAVSLRRAGGAGASVVVQEPRDEEELRRAIHSYQQMDVVPWGGHSLWRMEAAPHTLRRLPYLHGLAEAATLAILPVPDEDGAPGFPLKRRGGAKRHQVAAARVPGPAIRLGRFVHEGESVASASVPLAELTRHALIVGAPGSGKTTTVLSMLVQLWRDHHVPFLAIEPTKTEYRSMLEVPGMEELRVITLGRDDLAPIRLNPLEPPPQVRCETHMNAVMAVFKTALPLDPPLPQLLEEALERTYTLAKWDFDTTLEDGLRPPTIRDLVETYERGFADHGYRGEANNLLAALRLRLLNLTRGTRGLMLNTTESIDFEKLMSRPVVIEFDEIADNDEKAVLAAFILSRIRASARFRHGGDRLVHATVLEEAHRLLPRGESLPSTRALAIASFCEAIAEMRAYGEGFVISSQSPSALAPAAVDNTRTRVLHRVESASDRKVVLADFDAGELEHQAAARLGAGEAVVKWPALEESAVVRVEPAEGVDSGRSVSDELVRERMAEETLVVRRLLPHRLCTRDMCVGGCDARVRARGRELARAESDRVRALWREHEGKAGALAPIVDALADAAEDDTQLTYCAAAHLAGDGAALNVPGKDVRPQVAQAVRARTGAGR